MNTMRLARILHALFHIYQANQPAVQHTPAPGINAAQ
jgi:hypothetical protein